MIQSHAITVPHLPAEVRIPIRAERQQTAEWCWASCAAAVAQFIGLAKVPTEGELANLVTGRADCTSHPVPKECVVTAPVYTISAVYEKLGIDRAGPDLPLTINTLLSELIAGRPVEVGYLWYAGGGHVALVTGFKRDSELFYVSDPYFGDGRLNYFALAAGYGIGRWAVSYGRFKKRAA